MSTNSNIEPSNKTALADAFDELFNTETATSPKDAVTQDALVSALDAVAEDATPERQDAETSETLFDYTNETETAPEDDSTSNAEETDTKDNTSDSDTSGGNDNDDDTVTLSYTFTVDPAVYTSPNYRPIKTAKNIKNAGKMKPLGTKEAKESAQETDEPTPQEEEAAAQEADKADDMLEEKVKEIEDKAPAAKKSETEEVDEDLVVFDELPDTDGEEGVFCFDEANGIDYSVATEDKSPAPTKETCKTTFAQCKAANPLFCRFHGPKLLEADIKSALKATVGNLPISITRDKSAKNNMTFRLTITCPNSQKGKVESLIHKFMTQNPGIKSDEDWKSLGSKTEGFETETQEFEMDILKADKPPKKSDWELQGKYDTEQAEKKGKTQNVVEETPDKVEKIAKGEAPLMTPKKPKKPKPESEDKKTPPKDDNPATPSEATEEEGASSDSIKETDEDSEGGKTNENTKADGQPASNETETSLPSPNDLGYPSSKMKDDMKAVMESFDTLENDAKEVGLFVDMAAKKQELSDAFDTLQGLEKQDIALSMQLEKAMKEGASDATGLIVQQAAMTESLEEAVQNAQSALEDAQKYTSFLAKEIVKKKQAAIKDNVTHAKTQIQRQLEGIQNNIQDAIGVSIESMDSSELVDVLERPLKEAKEQYGIDDDEYVNLCEETENLEVASSSVSLSASELGDTAAKCADMFDKMEDSDVATSEEIEEFKTLYTEKFKDLVKILLENISSLKHAVANAVKHMQLIGKKNNLHNAIEVKPTSTPLGNTQQQPKYAKYSKQGNLAAMSQKDKLKAAIVILKGKLAASPNDATIKTQIAKYEKLLAQMKDA